MTGVTHTARPTERSELPPSRDRGTVAALRRFLSADVITSDQALRSGALIALASASAGLRVALGVTQAAPWLVGSGIGALALLAVHQIGAAAMTDRYRGVMRSVLAGYASLLIVARWIPQGSLGALDPLGILDIALNVGVLAMLAGEHTATSRPAPAAATAAAMPAHPATRGVRGATTVSTIPARRCSQRLMNCSSGWYKPMACRPPISPARSSAPPQISMRSSRQ